MTMRLETAERTLLCDTLVDRVDVGAGTALLQLWSGSRPATVGGAPAGTKLAEFSLPNPCFGAAASGVATAAAITGVLGLANGTVGFARTINRNGDVLWDNNDVGIGTGQIQLSTTTIGVGIAVDVTSWTVTMPAE